MVADIRWMQASVLVLQMVSANSSAQWMAASIGFVEANRMLNYGPAALIILFTFLSVFVGIFLNRRDSTVMRQDINRQFNEVNRRLSRIEDDQKHFYAVTGKMEGRIDELSRH